MFDAWCEGCGQTVFLSVRRIVAISNAHGGVHVEFLCRCGHRGSWTAGGAPQDADLGGSADYAAATITGTMV